MVGQPYRFVVEAARSRWGRNHRRSIQMVAPILGCPAHSKLDDVEQIIVILPKGSFGGFPPPWEPARRGLNLTYGEVEGGAPAFLGTTIDHSPSAGPSSACAGNTWSSCCSCSVGIWRRRSNASFRAIPRGYRHHFSGSASMPSKPFEGACGLKLHALVGYSSERQPS